MKRFIIFLIVILASVVIAEPWRWNYDIASNPTQLDRWMQDPLFPGDLTFDGTYDVKWDQSENTLEVLDNAVVAIGTGDDVTFSHDGTSTNVTGVQTLKSATPFIFEGASDDGNEITLKVPDTNIDLSVYGTFIVDANSEVAADALAIPVNTGFVNKTTGGDAEALTIADAEEGQIVVIKLGTDGGGDGTLTPATSLGFATIVFADAGDTACLLYVNDTVGWVIQGASGASAPPVITY